MKHRLVSHKAAIVSHGHAIGIDIGATAVRAAVLATGTIDDRPSVTVSGFGGVELAPGVVEQGVVQDLAALTSALKRLWAVNKFHSDKVILGVANQNVLVRELTIPDLDSQQRAKALPFQAREIVALPIDQVMLDFCPLAAPHPETKMVRGLLIATPRAPVLAAVTAVERAGLKVARVDLSCFGLLRSIADEDLTTEAIIDLGAQLTTIVIHVAGVPRLIRTVTRGGEELTQHVAERLGITIAEAEIAKCEGGLVGDRDEVTRAVVEGLRPLFAEIRTSIGYFRSTHDRAVIERISLTGGASQLPGIMSAICEQTGFPTRLVNPLQHVRNRQAKKHDCIGDAAQAPTAVSVGLAMGAAA